MTRIFLIEFCVSFQINLVVQPFYKRTIYLPDKHVWDFAKQNDFVIVTQDLDFNDLNSLYGFPPKIIWIRTGNLKTTEILDILLKYEDEIEKLINNLNYGCFEIFNVIIK